MGQLWKRVQSSESFYIWECILINMSDSTSSSDEELTFREMVEQSAEGKELTELYEECEGL